MRESGWTGNNRLKDWFDAFDALKGIIRSSNAPKKIVFIEVSKGATTEISEGKYEYRDPWGKPYQYLVNETPMDTMGLGAFKKDYAGPEEIRARALVWSAGPDGDYETWKDNVASWDY